MWPVSAGLVIIAPALKHKAATPRCGEYIDDVNRRYDANRDTVAIAHHGEGCMRILVRQNLCGIK